MSIIDTRGPKPSIAENLQLVKERIARAAKASSRDPSSIRLVAVSKMKTANVIREAYDAGHRDFGENYAQELSEKATLLKDLTDLRWHFIGHLQSNKAKMIVPVSHLVHTVHSPSLAEELSKRVAAGQKLAVLAEVNVGGEEQKHGATAEDLPDLLDAIDREPNIELRGLMTMPPTDLEKARRAFDTLQSLRVSYGGESRLPEMSMGMSNDLEVAIDCGATIVRVGTAIFGER